MTKRTVFIGLSGGVDSAVSAALLQAQGFRCVGVFLESWSEDFAPSRCQQAGDRRDAARVAAHLRIPFLVLPCAEEYRQRILQTFLTDLQAGRTPNPDVLCNEEIKFGLFADASLAAGADYIATGHYARVRPRANGEFQLVKARDSNKDQSYFLSRVDPQRLRTALFPVGDLTKPHVRALAARAHLPVAKKKDSQGVCFVGKIRLPKFLEHFFSAQPGPVVLPNGQLIGQHAGLSTVTIGQRHGLAIGSGRPLYVIQKDVASNSMVVSSEPEDLQTNLVQLTAWRTLAATQSKQPLSAKLRYRQPDQTVATLQHGDGKTILTFAEPQRAVTPGQVAVVYQGDTVVGSGVIV